MRFGEGAGAVPLIGCSLCTRTDAQGLLCRARGSPPALQGKPQQLPASPGPSSPWLLTGFFCRQNVASCQKLSAIQAARRDTENIHPSLLEQCLLQAGEGRGSTTGLGLLDPWDPWIPTTGIPWIPASGVPWIPALGVPTLVSSKRQQ